ncbi:chloride channel protein 2-like isoform X2 [Scaptodrosophila lebanonensis]|nr:chloride channel protein 2-like isoform X2 [Scaptodrosophila lebanonensis]
MYILTRLRDDWIFLAVLGITMALFSFIMDEGIQMCLHAQLWLYRDLTSHIALQYLAWVSVPICLILFAIGFVHYVGPQSAGSGIPEMRTILRGATLKDYLSLNTLIAKMVGLTAVLGSGMPLGKEGPFVHIASIVAELLSKLATPFHGIYENKSRNSEMLAAACAVGLGACFSAPIGGVLFSIEVTTTYFAVRNYWRGFFACVVGATVVRLQAVWFQDADTVRSLYPTYITTEFPYDPQELFIFVIVGVLCGLLAAFFVWVHRQYVLFMRANKLMGKLLSKNRFIYPAIITLIISSITFPLGGGQFMSGEIDSPQQLTQLFSNFTWTSKDLNMAQMDIVSNWSSDYSSIFINLICFTLFHFFFSIIGSTMALPHGMFIPALKIGGGFGRLIGESLALWLPQGFSFPTLAPIIPGGYAIVGAAAFSGAVTRSICVAVVVFEITGQIAYLVPVMIAVLVSNAVASLLQPSMYDSVTKLKNLPYLPDLLPSNSCIYNIFVEDFMVRDVKYIWQGITYQKLKEVLKANKTLRCLPLVDNPHDMILLGSVHRHDLINLIQEHIGRDRRLQVAQQWQQEVDEQRAREQAKDYQGSANNERRPSRFEVVAATDLLHLRQIANDEMLPPNRRAEALINTLSPRKSILLNRNSTDEQTDPEGGDNEAANISKRVQLPGDRVVDMSAEMQEKWERDEMLKTVNLDKSQINIDPAPFQLVERTSMLKAHSLFFMMGINHAYVTNIGRLVGVVSLKELRNVIEKANVNNVAVQNPREELPEEKALLSPSHTAVDLTITTIDSSITQIDLGSSYESANVGAGLNIASQSSYSQTNANENKKSSDV